MIYQKNKIVESTMYESKTTLLNNNRNGLSVFALRFQSSNSLLAAFSILVAHFFSVLFLFCFIMFSVSLCVWMFLNYGMFFSSVIN